MDHQSLKNVLGILRLMKQNTGNSAGQDMIRQWIGGPTASQTSILRVAAYVQEQVADATVVIESSQLPAEARDGIMITLQGLSNAFSLKGLGSSPVSTVPNITGAISSFVILLSVAGIAETPKPSEANDLIGEIEEMLKDFENHELDPVVRETAKRHLKILSTLLQHIPIFGVEAALATYFELMMKIRRADVGTTESSKTKLDPLFAKMERWAERLGVIDKVWNSGARLLNHAEKAQALLTYLPG